MAIAATDLIPQASASRPEDDTATSGGAIDVTDRPSPCTLAANDTLEMVSSQAADTTQVVTVTGRGADGAILTDNQTLNGTTPVPFTGTFERVLKVTMDVVATGIVTIRRASSGPTVDTIPINDLGFYGMFLKSASESAGTTRYEKIFWKNNHGTLTLNNAELELTADPSSKITNGATVAKDDSTSVANRKAAPGGVSFVDDGVAIVVPTGILAAGEAIGLWILMTLIADDAPLKTSHTTQLSGTSV